MTLYLHATLVAMVGDLDEAVEVVVRGGGVCGAASAAATCSIDVVLA